MVELTEWLCTECGRKHEFATDPEENKVCNDCGAFLKRAKEVPLTSNDELRALVGEWRYEHELPAGQQGANQVADAFKKCADELEALLDDTQAGDGE